MAWNHRTRVVAMAVVAQVSAGTFIQPNTTTHLLPVANPTNTVETVSADDPTATGAIWDANRIYLGKTATLGGSIPLRGPGGAAPPTAGTWTPGVILSSGGFAELRNPTPRTAVTVAGSTTTTLALAASESSVDDFLTGAPIQTAAIGTGFQITSIIQDYIGSTKIAYLAETLGSAPGTGVSYTIPMYVVYQLGTLSTAPPYLSVSIWRDKKRYDYRDFSPSSLTLTIPVANEANTSFSDIAFQGKAVPVAIADDTSPVLPNATLAIPIPPARGGKFYLDKVKLGHQQTSLTVNYTVGAASNQNQAAGQDAYDILSANRTVAIDLNQMAVTDFDLASREDNQTVVPLMETWGMGVGNRFGFLVSNMVLDPFSPGDRNGYVNLTGNAYSTDLDKSVSLAIWW